ncbi:hypothetical protein [Kribbella sp. CA-294648]|uniref:hypothetical protein n=1 Tax=Kribbella sp. CA-294648 TaxID=3239948 RepID=UPI003D8E53EF
MTLISCVAIEVVAYFVVLLTRSRQEPAGCDDYCWSDWDFAVGWGYLVVAPLVAGQLVVGGIAVARAASKDSRGISTGLLAFFGATALTLLLLFGVYYLQSS